MYGRLDAGPVPPPPLRLGELHPFAEAPLTDRHLVEVHGSLLLGSLLVADLGNMYIWEEPVRM